MANDTNQTMMEMRGGCRQGNPAPDETGMIRFPAGEVSGSWIYGAPQAASPGAQTHDVPPCNGDMSGQDDMPPMQDHGMSSGGTGMSSAAAQAERMRNPVSMANGPANSREAYQSSLRSLLERNIGYFVVGTFLVGTEQSVTWRGILYTVGSDYLVLYQPDYERYISCDIYSLKFMQFHNAKGIPYAAAAENWQGQIRY